ncbi:hypothetical protein SAMN05444392_101232 [Seinonella peptonophila]|uniref:Uncharacterized protein n=1 Tax=Seinonella peptonophila TaxID=112248 RepID=A0A1M4T0D4_9BACL|nr:hypothetical protein [Seinonella peptonophila]SHE37737.1 hypothetical protein SAMN05444392_101232 [Seinonella peptonophila]
MRSIDKKVLLDQWDTKHIKKCRSINSFRTNCKSVELAEFPKSYVFRQVFCFSAGAILFLASFPSVFAEPFHLEPPKEHFVPDVKPDLPNVPLHRKQLGVVAEEATNHVETKRNDTEQSYDQSETTNSDTQATKQPTQDLSEADQAYPSVQYEESSTMENQSKENQHAEDQDKVEQQTTHSPEVNKEANSNDQLNKVLNTTENGAKLPKTATNSWAYVLQGISFVLLGCALRKRRKTT